MPELLKFERNFILQVVKILKREGYTITSKELNDILKRLTGNK